MSVLLSLDTEIPPKNLKGNLGKEVYRSIYINSNMKNCQVVERNVQVDLVHLFVRLPPRLRVSTYMGFVKGRTAFRLFNKFPYLRKKKLWETSFGKEAAFSTRLGGMMKL